MRSDHSRPAPASQAHDARDSPALSDARERAIRRLTDAVGDDALSLDEFERRLDGLYAATAPAQVDALVANLPGPLPHPAPPAPWAGIASLPAAVPDATGRFLAVFGERERTGRWSVPPRLEVRALCSAVALDLRDALLPPGGCVIDVEAAMCEVRILVPPGVSVDGTANVILGTFLDESSDASLAGYGPPLLRITGLSVMSEIKVRVAPAGPSPKAAWKAAGKARKKQQRR